MKGLNRSTDKCIKRYLSLIKIRTFVTGDTTFNIKQKNKKIKRKSHSHIKYDGFNN